MRAGGAARAHEVLKPCSMCTHTPNTPARVRRPQAIYKTAKLRRTMEASSARKLKNRIAHSAPGSVKVKPERKKKVVAEVE